MSDHDPVDSVAPWTIKSVSTKTRESVTLAARREGLTVGQWLERRVSEWEGQGSPVPIASSAGAELPNLADIAQAMQATLALCQAAGVPVPPHVAKDGLAMVKLATRQVRGMSPPRPRPKLQAAIEGE